MLCTISEIGTYLTTSNHLPTTYTFNHFLLKHKALRVNMIQQSTTLDRLNRVFEFGGKSKYIDDLRYQVTKDESTGYLRADCRFCIPYCS